MGITKTWHPRVLRVLQRAENGEIRAELDSLSLHTLCDYYLCSIEYKFNNLRKSIELELECRENEAWIIPQELFTHLNPSLFGSVFARKVWMTTPATVPELIKACYCYFPPSFGIMIAYVMALAFNKSIVAAKLKDEIKKIETIDYFMPKFLELVQDTKGIPERLADLASEVQRTIVLDELEESQQVDEDIEKHNELNPKLFDADKLKPEVRNKALEVAQELVNMLSESEIPFKLKDIVLTGSNASYNYTKDSDADIHLIADMSGIDDPETVFPALFNAYKSAFNKKFNIDFYGVPVEVYIESADTPVVSNGIYSILQNKWIKVPKLEVIPDIDLDALDVALDPWIKRFKQLVQDINAKKVTSEAVIDNYINELYELRMIALQNGGEWALGNLIFKEIRNYGYLDKLKELRDELIAQRLSLKEDYLPAFWLK